MRVRDIQRRRGTPGGQQRRGHATHAAEQIIDPCRDDGYLSGRRRQRRSVQANHRTVSQWFRDTGKRRQANVIRSRHGSPLAPKNAPRLADVRNKSNSVDGERARAPWAHTMPRYQRPGRSEAESPTRLSRGGTVRVLRASLSLSVMLSIDIANADLGPVRVAAWGEAQADRPVDLAPRPTGATSRLRHMWRDASA